MAAAWGRAKRALATKLCIGVPSARQRTLQDEDASSSSPPPGWEACPSTPAAQTEGDSVTEEMARSSSLSMRRLSSSGSRSSSSKMYKKQQMPQTMEAIAP